MVETPRPVSTSAAAVSVSALMWNMRCSGRYTTSMTPKITKKFKNMGRQPAVGL